MITLYMIVIMIVFIYHYRNAPESPGLSAAMDAPLGLTPGASRMLVDIHYRGVQWEGGAVDWGSIM